jgi:hypothetical protein
VLCGIFLRENNDARYTDNPFTAETFYLSDAEPVQLTVLQQIKAWIAKPDKPELRVAGFAGIWCDYGKGRSSDEKKKQNKGNCDDNTAAIKSCSGDRV